ncbi:hypothetical protein TWF730_007084 [Orbilia blumenaviensis]|uniref:F-box domain-containing protein n=1 Tax=Orbilia blumenaviensis TaxID=1796055 RepID=A0AAV9VGI7_9PEZI
MDSWIAIKDTMSLCSLPFDLLAYILYDCIQDDRSLRAISLTCRLLRELALRRLNSEKVTLNTKQAGHAEIPGKDLVNSLLTSQDYRSMGLMKELCLDLNGFDCQRLLKSDRQSYVRFMADVEHLVEKCRTVRKAVLKEPWAIEEAEMVAVTRWSHRLSKIPSLEVLFIDLCDRNYHDLAPDHQYIARIEEPEICFGKGVHEGLECLSFQTILSEHSQDNYIQYGNFVRTTLKDNISSLNRLWFAGPELHNAISDMPASALASMKLKSLSIFRLISHLPLVRVLGLRPLTTDEINKITMPREDAVTGLEYLYLSNGRFEGSAEVELLEYLYTPKLKSLQIGANLIGPSRETFALLLKYLVSFSSLQRFGTTLVQNSSLRQHWTILNMVTGWHPNVKTLAAWNSWCSFIQIIAENQRLTGSSRRFEMNLKSETAKQGLFNALGIIIEKHSGNRSSISALSIGQYLWEDRYFAPREICTIISTILYIHQKRLEPTTPFRVVSNESQISPSVETPARQALFKTVAEQRKWPLSFINRSGQRRAIRKYLSTLASAVPPGWSTWNDGIAAWDTESQEAKETVVNGICDCVMYDLPDGFNRLEVEWKSHCLDRRWSRDEKDWRFVWDKTGDRWELSEYL